MMATRVVSASAASRNNRRQRPRSAPVKRTPQPDAPPRTKLTLELLLALIIKLLPKLLIGLGAIFVFVGILLLCMGYTDSRHYPQGRVSGLILLLLGLIGFACGLIWRLKRLRDAGSSGGESSVKYIARDEMNPTNENDVSSHVTENTADTANDGISGSNPGKKVHMDVPDIRVSYIDYDVQTPSPSAGSKGKTFDYM